MLDLFGKAMLDYQTHNAPENIITETSISEADEMDVAYLFRDYPQMPLIEQTALQLCFGKVLDIGCGAGSHSLYLQNERNLAVCALDISENAIQTCHLRGVKKAFVQNILDYDSEKFDTILLLMNGTGIFGKLSQCDLYLQKLKSLLLPGGQILIDSSDLIYMFDQDEDGAYEIPADGYYGELTFDITYKNEKEVPFDWLYLDFNTLQNAAAANGLTCTLVCEGENYDYLARLQ
ncbi:class I SAM-dependent methyltransferase [Flavobacterium agrisoli]|uniref:Class I SAM-dependent methyltransferase n=1 Tax=Flavobacterium agrisoli TaxID=2793066 RepID=A0A934PJE1_9FLAO|nr:class I SAM-dependent methyltransferase [Flavobacterium agrisoli]MBK0369221.1 class I SAM-dependent methyltransferase [Flavobacterium agrisoli]